MTCCAKHRLLGRRRFLLGGMASGGLLLVSGCSTNPITGREQLMLVSDDQLAEMSFSTWQQVRRKYRRGGTLAQRQAVERVGRDMVDASGLGGTRDWQFEVFEGPSNAFVLPGGQVAVFTGILEDFENDAQMAAVVGHEVGHVAARHSAERLSQNVLASLAVGTAGAVLAGMGTDSTTTQVVVGALGAGATFGILLPYSRQHELEADRLGVEYMARSGYDPREAREFWADRIAERDGSGPPEFMSTHPADSTRIAQIDRLLPQAMPVYERNARPSAPDYDQQGRRSGDQPPAPGEGMVACDLGDGRVVRLTTRTCFEVGGLPR